MLPSSSVPHFSFSSFCSFPRPRLSSSIWRLWDSFIENNNSSAMGWSLVKIFVGSPVFGVEVVLSLGHYEATEEDQGRLKKKNLNTFRFWVFDRSPNILVTKFVWGRRGDTHGKAPAQMSTWIAHGLMSYNWVLLLFQEVMIMIIIAMIIITATKISASSTRPARPWKSVNLGENKIVPLGKHILFFSPFGTLSFLESCQCWKKNVILLFHLVLNCVDLSDFPTRLPSIWSPQMPASQLIDCKMVSMWCSSI